MKTLLLTTGNTDFLGPLFLSHVNKEAVTSNRAISENMVVRNIKRGGKKEERTSL